MTVIERVFESEKSLPEGVRELIRDAHAQNTRKAYRSDLRAFRLWGGDVPTSPHELARYIAEEGARLHPPPSSVALLLSAPHTGSRVARGIPLTTHWSRQP